MSGGFVLPEAVARCIAPGAPEELRLDAARGAIPLPAVERVVSLTLLLSDPAPSVRAAARTGWEELPPTFFGDAVQDPRLPEAVLDLMAARGPGEPGFLLQVLRHPQVGRRTLERLLTSEDAGVLDAIAQNQRVLGEHPEVARRLQENPALHPAERSRLASLYGSPEPAAEPPREPDAEPPPAEVEAAQLPPDLPRALVEDGPEAEAETESKNLYQLVQSLTIAEKIKLANLGSKGARKLLARDTNRVVQRAVIRSPKIREDEILPIAQDRTTSDEILRIILERKDWLKHYPIRLALCQNPKTPMPRALRLLETLQDRDLRTLSKSRNIPSPVATGALRVLARRGKV